MKNRFAAQGSGRARRLAAVLACLILALAVLPAGADDFDRFLYRVRHESLTLSSMAFQDAGNLNIERLIRCSLHVYDRGKIKPFCARYLTPMKNE